MTDKKVPKKAERKKGLKIKKPKKLESLKEIIETSIQTPII
jgi:hypothetical protein